MKSFLKKTFLTCLGLFALNCSGETLISADPAESVVEDKSVTVEILHHGTSGADGEFPDLQRDDGTKRFVNDEGIAITLTEAFVSWGHVFLISEGEDEECEAGHDATLHVEAVEDLMEDDLAVVSLGTENIEDVSYCQFAVELTPENDHSPGADENAVAQGSSVAVAGTWSRGGGTEVPFAIAIAEEILVNGVFQSSSGATHPLHYHAGQTAKTIRFSNAYDRWFDGIDFTETADGLAREFKANVETHLGQFFGELPSEETGQGH